MKTFALSLLGALALSLASSARAQSGPASPSPLSGPNTVHAFIWDATHGMTDLGTLGGKISYAVGINDSGTVVGYSQLKGDNIYHAFLWTPQRGMVDIGASYPGGGSTDASGINASGEVAAAGNYGTGGSNGFQVPAIFKTPNRWISYKPSSTGGANFAFAINDAGLTTGQYYITVSGVPYVEAFVWAPKGGGFTPLTSIPGGSWTVGNAINNLTHVAGTGIGADGRFDGLFWTADGGSQNIGTLNGSAYTAARGLNDHDEIVGLNDPEFAGFYWTAATGMLPLQSLGGSQSAAFAINQTGVDRRLGQRRHRRRPRRPLERPHQRAAESRQLPRRHRQQLRPRPQQSRPGRWLRPTVSAGSGPLSCALAQLIRGNRHIRWGPRTLHADLQKQVPPEGRASARPQWGGCRGRGLAWGPEGSAVGDRLHWVATGNTAGATFGDQTSGRNSSRTTLPSFTV